jgi:triacylglycerol lipase
MEHQNKYPLVFVHGMFGWGGDEGLNSKIPYWGATTGDLMQYLSENGCECYSTSSGPVSSAWDRACEIYARLTGTKVDYGKVHSETYRHRRFGRTYAEPLFEGWSPEKKIHLIGHSHGGLTVRMLAHLLTYGSKEEREGTDEGDLSPLFEGGHEDLIKSVTAICAPHNGALAYTFAKKYKLVAPLKFVAFNYIGIMGRSKAEGSIFDFHLEQFGLSDTPGMQDAFPIRRAKKILLNSRDNVEFDLSPEGAKINNEIMEISPNIYYFSYAYSNVTKMKHIPNRYRAKLADFPFLTLTSNAILVMEHFGTPGYQKTYIVSANVGLVGARSALYPDDEPHRDFDRTDIQPGIWNVMPLRSGDHGTPIGLFADVDPTHDFYHVLIDILTSVE